MGSFSNCIIIYYTWYTLSIIRYVAQRYSSFPYKFSPNSVSRLLRRKTRNKAITKILDAILKFFSASSAPVGAGTRHST